MFATQGGQVRIFDTAAAARASAVAYVEQQLPSVKESIGFIFNRIWAAIKRESLSVVAEGVSTPQDVDDMWKINMGTKLGPFRLMDQVGLDIVLEIENHYVEAFPYLPTTARDFVKSYVDAGKLGRKSGEGFYSDYK